MSKEPKNFDDLRVSTMVVDVPLTTRINLMTAVSLIPLFYPMSKKTHKKKIELPPVASQDFINLSEKQNTDFGYCFPGDIIYAGYRNGQFVIKRGMIRSKKNPFNNAIELDIATEDKFINCRMSPDSIHVCGAKSEQMIVFAINVLLNKIICIQKLIDRCRLDIEKTKATIAWVLNECKGNDYMFVKNTALIVDPSKINRVTRSVEGHIIRDGHTIQESHAEGHGGMVFNPQFDVKLHDLDLLLSHILDRLNQTTHKDIYNFLETIHVMIASFKESDLIYKLLSFYESSKYFTFDQGIIPIRLMRQIQIFFDKFKDFIQDCQQQLWYKEIDQHACLICPQAYHTQNYPDSIDSELAKYLIGLIPDYIFYDVYAKQLNWFLTVDRLYEPDSENTISMCQIQYISINYNYSLACELRLFRLIDELLKLGIHAEQDTISQHWLTVHIPYKIPDDLKMYILKKEEKYVHTFIIYTRGSITQSGPHPTLNKIAFETFISAFNLINDKVTKKTTCELIE